MRYILRIVIVLFIFINSPVLAQENLAKQSQNPIGNMISLPIQNNTYFDVGPSEEWANSFQLHPVYPINLGKVNLISRAIIPVTYIASQDISTPDSVQVENASVQFSTDSIGGLGNITYQGLLSPAKPGKIIWGVGGVLQLPTATDDKLGTDKWSGGPGVVVLTMPGKWVLGFLTYNTWSFAGPSDEEKVNSFLFQYFVNYNLSDGWYLSSTPVITADWEANSDERWTIPFGLGIGRLVKIGKLPVDFKIQPFWYAEKPELGPEWAIQFQMKFLFPK